MLESAITSIGRKHVSLNVRPAREKDLYIERNEAREEISSSTGDKNEIAN